MKLEEVLQMIDELIAHNQKKIDEQNAVYNPFSIFESTDYYEGAIDALKGLRDEIKEGGEE